MTISEYASAAVRELELKPSELAEAAKKFSHAMQEGISGRLSCLKMLPSFISGPTGKEAGEVMAVDFGGTNVRILRASLDGSGGVKVVARERFPLKDDSKDYTSQDAEASELFGYIAHKAAELAPEGKTYPLGHTFSFPCEQDGINAARLIHWTKEIRTRGVEGQDVNGILSRALVDAKVMRVRPVAVINDTVGTLLAAAYEHRDVDVASICGTGHNTCYLEPTHPLTGKPMIVNMESGNFDGFRRAEWDLALDRESDRPGAQLAEKMVSGRYLGELVSRAARAMHDAGLLPGSDGYHRAPTGAELDALIAESGSPKEVAQIASEILAMKAPAPDAIEALRAVARAVGRRSARAAAATFAGTLLRVDPRMERRHVVAIDGSLYERMPGYDADIRAGLEDVLGAGAKNIETALAKDGSGIGAAIAAAIATKGEA